MRIPTGVCSTTRPTIAEGSITQVAGAPAVAASLRTPGANANNVDLATETMTAMQSTFRYQLLSRAYGDREALITTAIGGM